ncbi:MAG: cupin domain-containing protein [Candidatus Omnitrophica bacterium]|nr:cupin domain-containing protein [Candidatus Omnitrophota bacterium]
MEKKIIVEKPTPDKLKKLNIRSWPIWEKEESSFNWYYDSQEHCYFLEGEVEVELEDGKRIKIEKGDYVIFPEGLKCRWHIKKRVKKHYNFM